MKTKCWEVVTQDGQVSKPLTYKQAVARMEFLAERFIVSSMRPITPRLEHGQAQP